MNAIKVGAERPIEHTQCCVFLADEGADVGTDDGTPVTENYEERDSKFTGRIHNVTIEVRETKSFGDSKMNQVAQEAAKRKPVAD